MRKSLKMSHSTSWLKPDIFGDFPTLCHRKAIVQLLPSGSFSKLYPKLCCFYGVFSSFLTGGRPRGKSPDDMIHCFAATQRSSLPSVVPCLCVINPSSLALVK